MIRIARLMSFVWQTSLRNSEEFVLTIMVWIQLSILHSTWFGFGCSSQEDWNYPWTLDRWWSTFDVWRRTARRSINDHKKTWESKQSMYGQEIIFRPKSYKEKFMRKQKTYFCPKLTKKKGWTEMFLHPPPPLSLSLPLSDIRYCLGFVNWRIRIKNQAQTFSMQRQLAIDTYVCVCLFVCVCECVCLFVCLCLWCVSECLWIQLFQKRLS